MKSKNKRSVLVFLLVACFCVGNLLVPIHADSMGGLSDLLAQREEASNDTSDSVAEQIEKAPVKVSVKDFTDVKENDWFYTYLDYLVENGMVNGKTATTFEPDSSFSYAECSAVIVRYLGLQKQADSRMKEIANRDASLKNQWYLGYFQVLYELGIFDGYDLFTVENGKIVAVDKQAANRPVVRYRFAEFISRSFEIESELRARNVYSEIGGSGREFIVGGGYKSDVLSMYEDYISDFDEIPEEAKNYVLKAYYNGIFNGDISGNFYPHNNLTRAEMAKVLATISDYSLRTRLISDGYGRVVAGADLHTDLFGNVTVKYDVWNEILESEASKVKLSDGKTWFVNEYDAPFGYAIDAYLYENNGDGYKLSDSTTLHNAGDHMVQSYSDNVRILLVLRNVKENSSPEGVYDVVVENGVIVRSQPNIRLM